MTNRTQQKLGSGFIPKSEPAQILDGIDLSGKVAVVTGGYSGIGLETTRALASRGAKVYVPVRDPAKAKEQLANVDGTIVSARMDLGDLRSVAAFANKVTEAESRLDLLINNAGIMACPETRIGNNWEAQFATNHLGHFALTQNLLSTLLCADAPRVVCLTSTGHLRSGILWDDMHFNKAPYDKWVAYGQSKTANALFARALDLKYASDGLKALSVHPGGILTPLQRHLTNDEMQARGWVDENGDLTPEAAQGFKTPSQGCTTSLWAATSPQLNDIGGVYCEDCDVADPANPDTPGFSGVADWAADDEAALRLWEVTEALLSAA